MAETSELKSSEAVILEANTVALVRAQEYHDRYSFDQTGLNSATRVAAILDTAGAYRTFLLQGVNQD